MSTTPTIHVLITPKQAKVIAETPALADLFAVYTQSLADIERHRSDIEEARALYTNDDVEIDDDPLVSVAEKGVWVGAWVWVEAPEA